MPNQTILILSGTNRPGSNALRIAEVLKSHYQTNSVPVEIYSLAELPAAAFDPGCYATKPPAVQAIQQRVLDAAGLHVVTPEYNGSFPGVLKYFIDLLKFPESFENKPVAFTGEAMGIWGAIRSVEQLQLIFGYRNAHIYPNRVFIPQVHTKLDTAGKISDAELDGRLKTQAAGFAKYVRQHRASL
jgi:NAD(P)H-dependent FMN reductase